MKNTANQTVYPILFAICAGHFLNDLIQIILPASYPLLKSSYHLSYTEIGVITFAFQITSSLLQPFVGTFTDKRPQPYSFVAGMFFAFIGLLLLAFASNFYGILSAAISIGLGSSIFHPEASRVAYYASGGRRGLAQSIFQLGGNGGTAVGPLLIATIVIPFGQASIAFFVVFAVVGATVLYRVSLWYKNYLEQQHFKKNAYNEQRLDISKTRIYLSIGILLLLIFSKFFYTASVSNYYTFYLIERFGISARQAQIFLFIYMAAFTFGTFYGGPLGDKYGRKTIIWFSILGAAPFTLALPYLNFYATVIVIAIAGAVIASAFSSILVYAQELLPGKIGMISGLFYGFAFGMGGLGSAILGNLIDKEGIAYVYELCSFLPLIGILTVFLPNIRRKHTAA